MDIDSLPSTTDFEIKIVKFVKALEVDCYGVYNKHTTVLEHKDTSITRAYGALNQMQDEYDKMIKDIASTAAAKKVRSKGGVHQIGGGKDAI